ncbi:MAG: hypothetical protein F6K47_13330 [Symploca sp. SIO2E6]|nr:hypothetical protein [Symploca sp. SIO2E6]
MADSNQVVLIFKRSHYIANLELWDYQNYFFQASLKIVVGASCSLELYPSVLPRIIPQRRQNLRSIGKRSRNITLRELALGFAFGSFPHRF